VVNHAIFDRGTRRRHLWHGFNLCDGLCRRAQGADRWVGPCHNSRLAVLAGSPTSRQGSTGGLVHLLVMATKQVLAAETSPTLRASEWLLHGVCPLVPTQMLQASKSALASRPDMWSMLVGLFGTESASWVIVNVRFGRWTRDHVSQLRGGDVVPRQSRTLSQRACSPEPRRGGAAGLVTSGIADDRDGADSDIFAAR